MERPRLAPDHKDAADLGLLFTELNSILRRLRRRDPTQAERDRIAVLQEQISAIRRGKRVATSADPVVSEAHREAGTW